MFEAIRHQLMSHGPLTGEILSNEGDIYISRLKDKDGEILETCDHHFASLIEAKDWLKRHGVVSIQLQPSNAYFEMINN